MSKIILCCRTSDSFGISGRIFDLLLGHFGRGSVELDDLDGTLEEEKSRAIQDRVRGADIVLASIGRNWLSGIGDDNDPVRAVMRTALTAGSILIPVLVNGAGMPAADQVPPELKDLLFRNALKIDPGPDFERHVERLIHIVTTMLQSRAKKPNATAQLANPKLGDARPAQPERMTVPPPPAAQKLNRPFAATDSRIFISHSSLDGKIAKTLCQALESRGLRCWISSRDVAGGDNYQDLIVQAIHKAKIMLLVFTENANNSHEIKKEIALASSYKLVVIPVRIEDVRPKGALEFELSTRQWISFVDDWENAVDTLCERAVAILNS